MRNRTKLLLAALSAAAIMSMAVSSASARRINLSSSSFRIVWTSLEFLASSTRVLCPVTLEGSFHSRTISKVSAALIGYITSAYVINTCTGGTARALTETLPWHVQYVSFTGTLPSIATVTLALVGARFQVRNSSNLVCLAGTTQANAGIGISTISGGNVTTLRADETKTIPLERTGFLCEIAGSARFAGVAEVFVQGSTSTRIAVRLVQ